MPLSNGWTAAAVHWRAARAEGAGPGVGAPAAIRSQPPCGAVGGDHDEVMDTGATCCVLPLLRARVSSPTRAHGARRSGPPGNFRAAATAGGAHRALSGRLGCADPRRLHLPDRNRGSRPLGAAALRSEGGAAGPGGRSAVLGSEHQGDHAISLRPGKHGQEPLLGVGAGDAYVNQQQAVLDAVQTMRKRAQQAGNLKSTPQENVTTQGQTIVIQPANPEVVYVPEYDP